MFKQIHKIMSNLHLENTNAHKNELDQVIKKIPSPSSENHDIMPLPIAHLTSVESYNKIVNQDYLKTQRCEVFKPKNLIYFSYGNIFHRYGYKPTNSAAWLPVAFLFDPIKSMKWINYLFPYDTGAAYKKKYKNRKLRNFERYKILNKDSQEHLASKLVYYYFCSNKQYLRGFVDKTYVQKNATIFNERVLHELLNFLMTDLTDLGVDHRQRVIECQTESDIPLEELLNNLKWIGLPKSERKNFIELCRNKNISLPTIFPYECMVSRSPYHYTTILENKAKEFMEGTYFLMDEQIN